MAGRPAFPPSIRNPFEPGAAYVASERSHGASAEVCVCIEEELHGDAAKKAEIGRFLGWMVMV